MHIHVQIHVHVCTCTWHGMCMYVLDSRAQPGHLLSPGDARGGCIVSCALMYLLELSQRLLGPGDARGGCIVSCALMSLCTYSSSASASWALAMRAAATSGETRFFLMPLSLVTSRGLAEVLSKRENLN